MAQCCRITAARKAMNTDGIWPAMAYRFVHLPNQGLFLFLITEIYYAIYSSHLLSALLYTSFMISHIIDTDIRALQIPWSRPNPQSILSVFSKTPALNSRGGTGLRVRPSKKYQTYYNM